MFPLIFMLFAKQYKLFLVFGLFFVALCINYSTSDLKMNYAWRFYFHIFAASFFIAIFLFSKFKFLQSLKYFNLVLILLVILFCIKPKILENFSYYPRMIDSYNIVGSTLKQMKSKYDLKSITSSDAGVIAYESELLNLDNIGLGSSLVAQSKGINKKILDLYNPDIIILYKGKWDLKEYKQAEILQWAIN